MHKSMLTKIIGVLLLSCIAASGAEKPLPALVDGTLISGPGHFTHDGTLTVQGKVELRNLDLDVQGPIRVAAGSTLELDHVHLFISDPPETRNGLSGLDSDGPFTLIIRNSTMVPVGSAHPMWRLRGRVEVDNFQTKNSEFHLSHVDAKLNRMNIFELEISNGSHVEGNHLRLVFLSTHSDNDDRLEFSDIPADKPFSRKLSMGSQATADLRDAQAQLFLLYIHGGGQATLSRIGRAQLAFFPSCKGDMTLPQGRVGTERQPEIVPPPGGTDCPFRFTLKDVNVDTWDVYAGGDADLTFTRSRIDELNADERAKVTVRDSELYADWLAAAGNAQLTIEKSTVGSLRLAEQRPDLATSEVHLWGDSHARFSKVQFDCGIVAGDQARVELMQSTAPPKYIHRSGEAIVRNDAVAEQKP